MRVTVYGPGGFDPTLPNSNIIDERDEPDAPPAPPTAEERLAAAVAALAEVQLLSAPVLAADVLDVLDDLRAALEG
jgi:hypothetical protein